MATTTAKNKKQVDEMIPEDRMWDSLGYTYGQRADDINKSFDQARLNADKQAQNRGMQRSSYNNQVLANLDTERAKSIADNDSQKIAEYEKYLVNKDEAEAARAFQTSEREAQQAWQSGENALSRAFQTSEREGQQAYNTSERVAQQGYNTSERIAQQFYNTGEREAQQAYNTGERQAQQAWQSGENALSRAFQSSEREGQQAYNTSERVAQQAYQSGENALTRAYNTAEREAQQAWQSGESALTRAYNTAERVAQQAWQSGENQANRDLTRYQYDTNMNYQQSRDAIEDAFRERQYADSRADTAWNQAFQERQWQTQVDQWNKTFDYNSMSDEQKINYNYVTYALQTGADVSDEMLEKAGLSRADFNAMKQQAEESGATSGGYNPATTPTETTPPTDTDKQKAINDFITNLQKGIADADRGKANDFSGLKPNTNFDNITAPGATGSKVIPEYEKKKNTPSSSGKNVNKFTKI